ncbi:MAG TPA: hypothetical protein VKQ70_08435 [Caulobacteraceae bacterium]|jgi:hypothetical protein|nr:hypothetical protein [Caulobacteraceae bacterium]
MKLGSLVTISIALTAAPAALAQPLGAQWTGDICHLAAPPPKSAAAPSSLFEGHPKSAGATSTHPLACLPYPPRVKAHAAACQWVSDFYGGSAHEFEACREGDGVWRPSGRS